MAEVVAYHPETGAETVVDSEALEHHLRQAGWMTRAEHEEYQARLAEREQPAKAAKSKSEGEGKP